MKTVTTTLLLLVLSGICVFKNYAFPLNGTLDNLDIKLTNNEIEKNLEYPSDEPLTIDDSQREPINKKGKIWKLNSFNELKDRYFNIETVDSKRDNDIAVRKELTIYETDEIRTQGHDRHDETIESGHNQLSDHVEKLSMPDDSGPAVIMRIELAESDRYDITTVPTLDEQSIDNTTLPPMICWKMTCPDCSPQESHFRCLARGFLKVVTRSVFLGVVILLVLACVIVVNNKKKGNSADSRCKSNISDAGGDKVALIDTT